MIRYCSLRVSNFAAVVVFSSQGCLITYVAEWTRKRMGGSLSISRTLAGWSVETFGREARCSSPDVGIFPLRQDLLLVPLTERLLVQASELLQLLSRHGFKVLRVDRRHAAAEVDVELVRILRVLKHSRLLPWIRWTSTTRRRILSLQARGWAGRRTRPPSPTRPDPAASTE